MAVATPTRKDAILSNLGSLNINIKVTNGGRVAKLKWLDVQGRLISDFL